MVAKHIFLAPNDVDLPLPGLLRLKLVFLSILSDATPGEFCS